MFLKSIQHLSLGNAVTSSDKNIVIAWLKHIFISKLFAQHTQMYIKKTNLKCDRNKSRTVLILAVTYWYLHGQIST